MRICLVSGEFPPMQGGVGDFTRELGQAMLDAGHDVLILTSTRSAGPEHRRGGRVFANVAEWGWSVWRQAAGFFAEQRPDVVNIQYQTAAYGMRPAINLLPWRMRLHRRRPVLVVTFHDLLIPFLFRGAGPLRRWITDALARGCDGVIVTNEEDDAELARRAPRTPRRRIPIGANFAAPPAPAGPARQAWRARWGIGPAQLALSYFGFLNQSKGGEELIEALGRLVQAGRDVKLLMIGGKVGASDPTNRAYLARVEAMAQDRGLSDRVIWTDYLPDAEASATLQASDICVLPYRDGASTRRGTLMAALAHGLPVVTTEPAVPVAGFRDGENMLFAPRRDAAALAATIARLADAPALRRQLAAGAAELASQFTWPAIAAETLRFYAELLRDAGAQRSRTRE